MAGRNAVCMPLNNKVQRIDRCIHQLVAALNAGGVRTTLSCCGHGEIPGRIDLEDGRVLVIPRREDIESGELENGVLTIPCGGMSDPMLRSE